MGLGEPPATCCMDSYLVFRFLVEMVSSSSWIGCNHQKKRDVPERSGWSIPQQSGRMGGEVRKVLQGEAEADLPREPASVCGWPHPKQDPDNCDPFACFGHREPRPSCPRSCKGGHCTGPLPGPLLASCFLADKKTSPVRGEDKNPASLMNYLQARILFINYLISALHFSKAFYPPDAIFLPTTLREGLLRGETEVHIWEGV